MKFAPKIIFLVRDPDGFGPSIFNSLITNPNSNLTKSVTSFELSLANYGVTDQKASGDLINFLDPQGLPQVSILLLPNYAPPIAACAVREVLSAIASENLPDQPTIILPFIMKAPKFNREVRNLSSEQEVTLYAAEIGTTTDFARVMIAGIASISSSLQLNCEPLACLLHMVRVLSVSTVLLIASDGQSQNKRSSDYELEVKFQKLASNFHMYCRKLLMESKYSTIPSTFLNYQALCKVGEFMAGHLGLSFSKDGLQHKQVERSRREQEPWRSLYL